MATFRRQTTLSLLAIGSFFLGVFVSDHARPGPTADRNRAILEVPASSPDVVKTIARELRRRSPSLDADRVAHTVVVLSQMHHDSGVTPSLILGFMEVESGYRHRAISSGKAYGLMQVLRSTATPYLQQRGLQWSTETILDPVVNIDVGVQHLVELHRCYMNERLESENDFTFSALSYTYGQQAVRDALHDKGIALGYYGKVQRAANRWGELLPAI